MQKWISYLPYLAWFAALSSTLGSLYFSEIAGFPPCVLCWYQRITMYPLVAILAVGIIKKDKNLPLYVLPLSLIGLLIALYQNLLTWGVINEAVSPCALGVSCTTKFIDYFGFITIPFLSLLAFTFITISMVYYMKAKNDDRK